MTELLTAYMPDPTPANFIAFIILLAACFLAVCHAFKG